MNYSDIIYEGFTDQNDREFLEDYFIQEFRKAEKDHYTARRFFTGCIREIEALETWINNAVAAKKHELFKLIESAKDGTLQHTDLKGKTIEQANQETIEYCEKALQNETPGSIAGQTFGAPLLNSTYYGDWLTYNEVKFIKESLMKAWQTVNQADQINQPKPGINTNEIPERLEQIFESVSKYKKVMEILVENGYIEPNTYIYKDRKKGNKSFLAALIKDLHLKGYLKVNPTNDLIKLICKNSFKYSVGIDCIKKAKAENFETELKIIQVASTIE